MHDSALNISELRELLQQQSPQGDGLAISESDVREALANPNFYLFCAVEVVDGLEKLVGMASIFFQKNLARWIAEIHDVVVDTAYRGGGIGEMLTRKAMGTAHAFCAARGIELTLSLTSRPSRVVANRLYERLGFVLSARANGKLGTNLYELRVNQKGLYGH